MIGCGCDMDCCGQLEKQRSSFIKQSKQEKSPHTWSCTLHCERSDAPCLFLLLFAPNCGPKNLFYSRRTL